MIGKQLHLQHNPFYQHNGPVSLSHQHENHKELMDLHQMLHRSITEEVAEKSMICGYFSLISLQSKKDKNYAWR